MHSAGFKLAFYIIMTKMARSLFLFLSILLVTNICFARRLHPETIEKIKQEHIENQKVSALMVKLVRNEYRMAIHLTARMLACFTGDKQWFKDNYKDFRDDPMFCEGRIDEIRSKVREKLPLVRAYMALSMMGSEKRIKPFRVTGPLSPEDAYHISLMNSENNNIMNATPGQNFPSTKISPLSFEEFQLAWDILSNDLQWLEHKMGLPRPQNSDSTCFFPERNQSSWTTAQRYARNSGGRQAFPEHDSTPSNVIQMMINNNEGIGRLERDCYKDIYLSHIFGSKNTVLTSFDCEADPDQETEQAEECDAIDSETKPWTKGIEGFPLLAYFDSGDSSDASIVEALRKRLQLTVNRKIEFEERYYKKVKDYLVYDTPDGEKFYETQVLKIRNDLTLGYVSELFIYKDLMETLSTEHPELKNAVDRGTSTLKRRQLMRGQATFGVIIASIPICTNLVSGTLLRALCMMPFGLGFNRYMLSVSEKKLRNAVNDLLASPNAARIINHVDSLDDYQFNRNLDLLLLPLGAGGVNIIKGFSGFKAL